MASPIIQQINAELESLNNELTSFRSKIDYLNLAENYMKEAIGSLQHSERHFESKINELKKTYSSFIQLSEASRELTFKIDTINFPDRLDRIEATVKETIEFLCDANDSAFEQLNLASEKLSKVDLDYHFSKLQQLINDLINSNKSIVYTIEKQSLPDKINAAEVRILQQLGDSFQEFKKNSNQNSKAIIKSIDEINPKESLEKLNVHFANVFAEIINLKSSIEKIETTNKKVSDNNTKLINETRNDLTENMAFLHRTILSISRRQQKHSYITWGLIGTGILLIMVIREHT